MSGWPSMAILTLSQTSCLRLLKCQFSLGKLDGGVVRPRWADVFYCWIVYALLAVYSRSARSAEECRAFTLVSLLGFQLVCARRCSLIIINVGFAMSATLLSFVRKESRQRNWHRCVFCSNLNRHFKRIISRWPSMAILTLSQTSCLWLLKCQFSLGKLDGGVVRPRWADVFYCWIVYSLLAVYSRSARSAEECRAFTLVSLLGFQLVCARRCSLIIINIGFAMSATHLSLIRRERWQRDWHRGVFCSNLNRHFKRIMSGWPSEAILTLSQTSCLRLLKCQFSLGKLYGGHVVATLSHILLWQFGHYFL